MKRSNTIGVARPKATSMFGNTSSTNMQSSDLPSDQELDRLFDEFLLERFGSTTDDIVAPLKEKPKEAKWMMIKMQRNFNEKQHVEPVNPIIASLRMEAENPVAMVNHLKKLTISLATYGGRWFSEFVQLKGIDTLLQSYVIYDRGSYSNHDVIKEAINALSRVMRYHVGIETFTKIPQALRIVTSSLDSPIEETRNNVMFILTAVGMWMESEDMFQLTLDALSYFKIVKAENSRFQTLVNILKNATSITTRINALTLINVLLSADKAKDLAQIKQDLTQLNIRDVVKELPKTSASDERQETLSHQINTFNQLINDEIDDITGSKSAFFVLSDIYDELFETDIARAEKLLGIIINLNKLYQEKKLTDELLEELRRVSEEPGYVSKLASRIDTLQFHITLLEKSLQSKSAEAIKRLPDDNRLFMTQNLTLTEKNHNVGSKQESEGFEVKIPLSSPQVPNLSIPPPPPPIKSESTEFISNGSAPPPPPPPIKSESTKSISNGSAPPPPPPPISPSISIASPRVAPSLPALPTLKPSEPTKNLHWLKVDEKVVEKTIWIKNELAANLGNIKIRSGDIESLFASKKNVESTSSQTPERMKEISLLDGRRQQQLLIFIGSVRKSNDEIVNAINNLDETKLSAEVIQKLIDNAPTQDEIEAQQMFEGDVLQLSKSDQFIRAVMQIPRLKQKLESWLFKINFNKAIVALKPDILAVTNACEQLCNSQKWQKLLQIILAIGNFMNGATAKGVIHGFKISALNKLKDTRSADNKTTLLNYIVEFVGNDYPELDNFREELSSVEIASKVTDLDEEFKKMQLGLKAVQREIEMSQRNGTTIFSTVMSEFAEDCMKQVQEVETFMNDMKSALSKLAVFYGEDEKLFTKQSEEFFKDVKNFIQSYEHAKKENEEIKERKRKEEERKKKIEENKPITPRTPRQLNTEEQEEKFSTVYDGSALIAKLNKRNLKRLSIMKSDVNGVTNELQSMLQKRLQTQE